MQEAERPEQGSTKKYFDMPELYEGMTLRVLTEENRLVYVGRVQTVQGHTVQIFDDTGANVPHIVYNTKVKLRGFSQNHAITLEGVISGSTEKYWWIEQLRSLQGAEQRAFFRQSARLEGMVMAANGIYGNENAPTEGIPFPCSIMDLSAGGTMIRARTEYRVGDRLLLVNISIDPGLPPATFTCIVRRILPVEGDTAKKYGCEFYRLEGKEREQLIQAIFKFQRKELQDRRSELN